jgi:hypothetical protein
VVVVSCRWLPHHQPHHNALLAPSYYLRPSQVYSCRYHADIPTGSDMRARTRTQTKLSAEEVDLDKDESHRKDAVLRPILNYTAPDPLAFPSRCLPLAYFA